LLKKHTYYVGLEMKVYPRYRLISHNPVVIETEKGYLRIDDPDISRMILLIAHMPGSHTEKIAWSYVLASESEDIDLALEEAYALLRVLEEKELILVVE